MAERAGEDGGRGCGGWEELGPGRVWWRAAAWALVLAGSLAVTPWPGTCLISGCSSILIPVNEVGLLRPPRLQRASGVGQPLPPKQIQAAKLLLAD